MPPPFTVKKRIRIMKKVEIKYDGVKAVFPKVRISKSIMEQASKGLERGRFYHHRQAKKALALIGVECGPAICPVTQRKLPLHLRHTAKGWYQIGW